MRFSRLFRQYEAELEDFWGRRDAEPRFAREFRIFGRAVQMISNEKAVISAVDHSLPLYSTSPATDHPPFTIQVVVRATRVSPGPVPDELMNRNWYGGSGDWLAIHADRWGMAHVDLRRGQAILLLAPELAERPEMVSRCLLDTILLNFCLCNGFGMLHASCLIREGKALLLMAPHNMGKSTTALHLVLAGYTLVADSMIHISPHDQALLLAGFPVGKVKIRPNVVSQFPQLAPFLKREHVRDELKYGLDLREWDARMVEASAVSPGSIDLCLLNRSRSAETSLFPAKKKEVWEAVMRNSLYVDTLDVWQQNLAQIQRCINVARWHHLSIGSDVGRMVAAVDSLWDENDDVPES